MNTLSIESWYKPVGAEKSMPLGLMRFHVSDRSHLDMESAEEQLQHRDDMNEMTVPADMASLHLETPKECGELSDCEFHVYLNPRDQRGHFFLMGHRASDGALVYSNAVMVDQLG